MTKIIDHRDTKVELSTLEPGDTFCSGGMVLVILTKILDDLAWNAVEICSGGLYKFDIHDLVEKVDIEIHLVASKGKNNDT